MADTLDSASAAPAVDDAFDATQGSGCSSGHRAACGCSQASDPRELNRAIQAGAPSYFRSYEELKTAMYALAEKYPDLVEVVDIGDSWEKTQGTADRDILALRLTRKPTAGELNAPVLADKPKTLWLGGVHAREIANPELLMRFAEQTLGGYGTDPEATAMLENRELLIVPMVNPDGHARIERGYATGNARDLDHRKNTSGKDGTDLNRNFDFMWGQAGSSPSPTSPTYRGASAASEPETQAIQALMAAEKPDLFIDWHSHGQLVMSPWGYTKDLPADHAGLDALGKRFAADNGYTPQRAIDLYQTSGTSRDYAYGKHGIPAFTIETGRRFHQTDAEFEETWTKNAPVMAQSIKVADAPLERAFGPDATTVGINGSAVTAAVSDGKSGGQTIRAVEWFVDPSTQAGAGHALAAEDGAFDEADEVAVGEISTALPRREDGRVLVYVRAQDADGHWGAATAQWMNAA